MSKKIFLIIISLLALVSCDIIKNSILPSETIFYNVDNLILDLEVDNALVDNSFYDNIISIEDGNYSEDRNGNNVGAFKGRCLILLDKPITSKAESFKIEFWLKSCEKTNRSVISGDTWELGYFYDESERFKIFVDYADNMNQNMSSLDTFIHDKWLQIEIIYIYTGESRIKVDGKIVTSRYFPGMAIYTNKIEIDTGNNNYIDDIKFYN